MRGAQPGDPAALKAGLQGPGRGGDKLDLRSEPDSEHPLSSPLVVYLALPTITIPFLSETQTGANKPGHRCVYRLPAGLKLFPSS